MTKATVPLWDESSQGCPCTYSIYHCRTIWCKLVGGCVLHSDECGGPCKYSLLELSLFIQIYESVVGQLYILHTYHDIAIKAGL